VATLFKRSNGIYYVVEDRDGRRVWRSTGARTRRDALNATRRVEPKPVKPPKKPSLSKFSETFFPYAEANLAPTTVALYREGLRTLIRLLGDRELGSYSTLDLEKFKALRLKEVSPSKVNIDFANMKAFFQRAVTWGLLEKNPCKGVKLLKIPPRRPPFLTREDFCRLLDTVQDQWFRELIIFAASTMMRAGEIVNLTWNSVDMGRRVILVENTLEHRLKTTQPHAVPMNGDVYSILSQKKGRVGIVFPNPRGGKLKVDHISHKFKKHVKRAGISEDLHFHCLRHTGASWLVQAGVSIYAVQKLLGHSDIKVTMMYSHLVTTEMHESVNKINIGEILKPSLTLIPGEAKSEIRS
jgi:integrase